jgi:hypothetical protein
LGENYNPDQSLTEPCYRVGRIAAEDLGILAQYRNLPNWSVLSTDEGDFWLRVPVEDDESFSKLPLAGRWRSGLDGLLVREGRKVPESMLPMEMGWIPVGEFLKVSSPLRGALGMRPPALAFVLETDDAGHEAEALLCDGQSFADWVETAFAPRLELLRFAFAEDGRALVLGLPLPAIAGSGLYPLGRLWLPCGYRLPDHVWPELVEDLLALGGNRLAILDPDGSFEEIDEENLVPATRSAVRTTLRQNLCHD